MTELLSDWSSPEARSQASKSRGRRAGTLAGSYIADKCALQKCICLCLNCVPRFEPKAHGYYEAVMPPFQNGAIGECDDCREVSVRCFVFLFDDTGLKGD
ncbi:hypothetical protein KAR91_51920 [Candidatus Pacearchaeota archaeon]|nr:hypothetical protein [Candidatus Pacearchaeota archaeon]